MTRISRYAVLELIVTDLFISRISQKARRGTHKLSRRPRKFRYLRASPLNLGWRSCDAFKGEAKIKAARIYSG